MNFHTCSVIGSTGESTVLVTDQDLKLLSSMRIYHPAAIGPRHSAACQALVFAGLDCSAVHIHTVEQAERLLIVERKSPFNEPWSQRSRPLNETERAASFGSPIGSRRSASQPRCDC